MSIVWDWAHCKKERSIHHLLVNQNSWETLHHHRMIHVIMLMVGGSIRNRKRGTSQSHKMVHVLVNLITTQVVAGKIKTKEISLIHTPFIKSHHLWIIQPHLLVLHIQILHHLSISQHKIPSQIHTIHFTIHKTHSTTHKSHTTTNTPTKDSISPHKTHTPSHHITAKIINLINPIRTNNFKIN